MKKLLNKKLFVLLILILLIFSGCNQNTIDITSPLFSVTQPQYKSASEDSRCVIGGVYFDFYNKADCRVVYLETRMNVYDKSTGKSAFAGYGTITSADEVQIKKGEIRQMCVPLDQYITVVPQAGYYIDQFYVNLIEYEDGKIWKDECGLYACGSRE